MRAERKSCEREMDVCLKLKGALDNCLEKPEVFWSVAVRCELCWWGTLILISARIMNLLWKRKAHLTFVSVNITILVVLSMKISHIRVMSSRHLTQRSVTQRLSSHQPAKLWLWADIAEQFQMSWSGEGTSLSYTLFDGGVLPPSLSTCLGRYIFLQDTVRTWVTLHMAVFASPVRVARSLLATWHGSQHVSRTRTISRFLDLWLF